MLRWFWGGDAFLPLASRAAPIHAYPGTLITFGQTCEMRAGKPGPANSGANGQSLWFINTAFGEVNLARTFDAQSRWGIHLDWRMFNLPEGTPAGAWGVVEWLRIGTTTATLFSVRTRADKKLAIYGPAATLLKVLTFPFTGNDWHNLEFQIDFGTSGRWELHIDDTAFTDFGFCNFGGALPSLVNIRDQLFGNPAPNVDNIVIWDGQGSTGNTFLGPCRITTIWPASDQSLGTWASTEPTGYQAVRDLLTDPNGAPDLNSSYIAPSALGDAFFGVGSSPCFGRNLAVAVNLVARPTSGSPTLQALVKTNAVYALGSAQTLVTNPGSTPTTQAQHDWPVGFALYQTIVVNNPETSDVWTDAQIQSAAWGCRAGVSISQRVTQLYLEKLTTLRAVPYTCGGGSYVVGQ